MAVIGVYCLDFSSPAVLLQVSPMPAASGTVTSSTVVDTDYKKVASSTLTCLLSLGSTAMTSTFSPGDVIETAGKTINIGECIDADTEKYIFKNCMP